MVGEPLRGKRRVLLEAQNQRRWADADVI
jgi:hypothetical protein